MLYWMGSTMMAAISPRCRFRTASRALALLYGATTVSVSCESGMPADAGTELGASGGPMSSAAGRMLIRTSSWWPW